MQGIELCLDLVVFLLQCRNGIVEAADLARADLQTVLRLQELVLGIGDAAVLRRIQLIQQVVKGLMRLVGQHRQITACGILGLGQQVDGAVQTIQPLAQKPL